MSFTPIAAAIEMAPPPGSREARPSQRGCRCPAATGLPARSVALHAYLNARLRRAYGEGMQRILPALYGLSVDAVLIGAFLISTGVVGGS